MKSLEREIQLKAVSAGINRRHRRQPGERAPAVLKKSSKTADKIGLVVQGLDRRSAASGVYDQDGSPGYGAVADEIFGMNAIALNASTGVNGGFYPAEHVERDHGSPRPPDVVLWLNPMAIPMPNGTYEEAAVHGGEPS